MFPRTSLDTCIIRIEVLSGRIQGQAMNCCSQCAGIERLFDDKLAENELNGYRKHGPARTTRILLDALESNDVQELTVLDIGGGVGAIQHELLDSGAQRAVHVDASAAYIHAAQQEAERRGHADQTTYLHGDFVALAPQIEPADIVTLDRVLCCYDDMRALVSLSVERTRRYYGLVFPRYILPFKLFRPVFNTYFRLVRNPYRFYLHDTTQVESLIVDQGFRRVFRRAGVFWQVLVYERTPAS